MRLRANLRVYRLAMNVNIEDHPRQLSRMEDSIWNNSESLHSTFFSRSPLRKYSSRMHFEVHVLGRLYFRFQPKTHSFESAHWEIGAYTGFESASSTGTMATRSRNGAGGYSR